MPGMCRSNKAEKLFRDIMGVPQNASKKFSVKNKKKAEISKTQPFNANYSQSQDFPNEKE